ncbi:unnamed protein product, partial [Prorocentrum cordatum]
MARSRSSALAAAAAAAALVCSAATCLAAFVAGPRAAAAPAGALLVARRAEGEKKEQACHDGGSCGPGAPWVGGLVVGTSTSIGGVPPPREDDADLGDGGDIPGGRGLPQVPQ